MLVEAYHLIVAIEFHYLLFYIRNQLIITKHKWKILNIVNKKKNKPLRVIAII